MHSHNVAKHSLHATVVRAALAVTVALLLSAIVAGTALGSFGMRKFDVFIAASDDSPQILGNGIPATQAGSHPHSVTTDLAVNYVGPFFQEDPDGGQLKDAVIAQMPGLIGDSDLMPYCSTAEFGERAGVFGLGANCPDSTAVGVAGVSIFSPSSTVAHRSTTSSCPRRAGSNRVRLLGVPVVVDLRISDEQPYDVVATVKNTSEAKEIYRSQLTLWGVPASSEHDPYRGRCLGLSESLCHRPSNPSAIAR